MAVAALSMYTATTSRLREYAVATGVLVIQNRVLPRWLARIAVISGTLLFLQGFGLGVVIGTYGLVLDLVGFVLFLLFVLLSSAISIREQGPARATEPRSA